MLSKQKIPVYRLFELLHGIDTCSQVSGSFGFSYALGRSKKIIMDECKDIEKVNNPEPGYEAYQRERYDLIETQLAKKTGDQIEYVQSSDGSGKVPAYKDPAYAEKALAELASKYSQEIETRKNKNREYVRIHQEESVEIELYLIKKEFLPEDKLTPAMVYAIYELIEPFK